MLDPLTKIPGVPSKDEAIPGMAYFAGTGPYGKTCGVCKHRGLTRQSQKATWSENTQNFEYKYYRTAQCQMFKRLAGEFGAPVDKENPACKYFDQKAK